MNITQLNANSRTDADKAFENYNLMARQCGLSEARALTPQRKRALAGILSEFSLTEWNEALGKVENSPFLCGENDRGWRANIDFLLRISSFVKVLEGYYER